MCIFLVNSINYEGAEKQVKTFQFNYFIIM